jgi:4'-phosphopantetheinyl transferase
MFHGSDRLGQTWIVSPLQIADLAIWRGAGGENLCRANIHPRWASSINPLSDLAYNQSMADTWLAPPADLCLTPGEVHVFRLTLAPEAAHLSRLSAFLSVEERGRAARFLFDEIRRAFIAARGQMRQVLGSLLEQPPAALHFETGARGKPYLPGSDLQFNLSHSGEMALLAVTLHREVGVDIEWTARSVDFEGIAPRFFAAGEVQAFTALPDRERRRAFFTIWTRKEAYIKACGQGLYLPLHSFTVSHTDPPTISVPGYSIHALDPGPGYAAALVVEGEIGKVSTWDWPGDMRGANL